VYTFCELPSYNLGVCSVKMRNFGRDFASIWRRSSFVTLAFRNGLKDRNFDFRTVGLIGNHFCTSCRNLVRFGSVTADFTVNKTTFSAIWQKSAYHAKYLRISWATLYRFGRHISGDDYPNIHLAVAQGSLPWQIWEMFADAAKNDLYLLLWR